MSINVRPGQAGGPGGAIVYGLSAGTQVATSGTVIFSNSNNMTFGMSNSSIVTGSYTSPVVSSAIQNVGTATNSGTNTSRFAADDHVHLGVFSVGVSTGGNTLGNTSMGPGQLVLAGGSNVTLSQSTGAGGLMTVTIVGAAGSAVGGDNTIGMSNLGNTSGTTGVVTGSAVQYLFAGGNNVTLSQSLNGVSGTVTISAFNQTVESQTFGMSDLGNTSGTTGVASGAQVRYLFAGGNNVTLSQSLNGASGTVTISAFNQSVESQSIGMSNVGNTSGTTGVASGGQVQYILAGGNNITLSQSLNGASGTVTISAFNQSVESQSAGMSNLGNTAGTTGIASGGQVQFLLAGGNNITLSQSVNGASATVTVSAFNQSAESQSGGMSNLGNTAGTTGIASGAQIRLLFAGGNNVTLSQSVNGASATITVSAFNQSAESQSVGMSNVGNTSGDTGVASGAQVRYVLAGGNNVTLSQSLDGASATVTISAFNQSVESQSIGMSNIGNTSGTTGMASGAQVRFAFAGGNNITLSQSLNGASGTITISGANSVAAPATLSIYENITPIDAMQNVGISGSTQYVCPFYLPQNHSISFIRFMGSWAFVSTSFATSAVPWNTTFSRVATAWAVIYTQNAGASSMSLASYASGSVGWTYQVSAQGAVSTNRWTVSQNLTWGASGGAGNSNFQSTYASTLSTVNVSTTGLTDYTQRKWLDIPLATSLSAGNYWVAFGQSSTTAGGKDIEWRASIQIVSLYPNDWMNMGAVSASSLGLNYGVGSWSTNAINTTASIAFSEISTSSNRRPYFQLLRFA